jgi:hypothetical protein
MLVVTLLLACTPHAPPVTAPTATTPVVTAEPEVSFSSLETRAAELSADLDDADARARLAALRELMATMRGQPASAQRKVFGYATRVLALEERARPEGIAFEGFEQVVEVSDAAPQAGPDEATRLADARAALAAREPARALAVLEGLSSPPAQALRRSATDAWAAAEREAAGADFLTARDLARGPARTTALRAVRDRLATINARYPENAVAVEVARHLERVDAAIADDALPPEP